MAFDQVRFEDQGLFLGPGDDGLEGNNFFNQQRCFRIRECRPVKIGRQPFFEGNGLADVKDLPVDIFHQVDPRSKGGSAQLHAKGGQMIFLCIFGW